MPELRWFFIMMIAGTVAALIGLWQEGEQQTRRHEAVVEACADVEDRTACVTALNGEDD